MSACTACNGPMGEVHIARDATPVCERCARFLPGAHLVTEPITPTPEEAPPMHHDDLTYPVHAALAQLDVLVGNHGGTAYPFSDAVTAGWALPGGHALHLAEGNLPGFDAAVTLRRDGHTLAEWEGRAEDAPVAVQHMLAAHEVAPEPPLNSSYIPLLDYAGHPLVRNVLTRHVLGYVAGEGWVPVAYVVAATPDQITYACGACPTKRSRKRHPRLEDTHQLHHSGRSSEGIAQVRSPLHEGAGGVLVLDPYGHLARTPKTAGSEPR